MSKIYCIANDYGFLMKAKTKKGRYKFRNPRKAEDAWFTLNKLEAVNLTARLHIEGYLNKFSLGCGVVEVDNSDHSFDNCLS